MLRRDCQDYLLRGKQSANSSEVPIFGGGSSEVGLTNDNALFPTGRGPLISSFVKDGSDKAGLQCSHDRVAMNAPGVIERAGVSINPDYWIILVGFRNTGQSLSTREFPMVSHPKNLERREKLASRIGRGTIRQRGIPSFYLSPLREWRKRKRVTQKELATRCRIHESSISQLESRRTMPSLEIVYRLSQVTGISLKRLTLFFLFGAPRNSTEPIVHPHEDEPQNACTSSTGEA